MADDIKYWLCCGSMDPKHNDERAKSCIEMKMGYPHHCIFGTSKEHHDER